MSITTKILIVDDEVMISDYIFEMLSESGFSKIKTAYNSKEALQQMSIFQPNIILMDINIDGADSGIHLAKQKNEAAGIIYITAQNDSQTIENAIATNPVSYLTKPIKKVDLLAAIQLAGFKSEKKYTTIKDKYQTVKLFHNEILYIKSDNVYIDIHTKDKKYSLRQTLDNFFIELDDDTFCKTHRSYIINKKYITKKTNHSVFLADIEIPISRNSHFEL
jgi:two-component system response regulator LytT